MGSPKPQFQIGLRCKILGGPVPHLLPFYFPCPHNTPIFDLGLCFDHNYTPVKFHDYILHSCDAITITKLANLYPPTSGPHALTTPIVELVLHFDLHNTPVLWLHVAPLRRCCTDEICPQIDRHINTFENTQTMSSELIQNDTHTDWKQYQPSLSQLLNKATFTF